MKAKYKELSFYNHRIRIRIEGFKTDRLLDKAFNAGILLKDVKFVSETELLCTIPGEDLPKLKKIARTLYRITEIHQSGVGHIGMRLLKSPFKLVGMTLALALIIFQSLFVSTIEVDGYRAIPETDLLKCLELAGIKEGVYRPGIDWAAAEKMLFDTFPQLTWVQLVYDGRTVYLNIAESAKNIMTKDTYKKDNLSPLTYCDIVASASGYIQSMNTYLGLACAEVGDYVRKGQVLITGCVPMEATTFLEDWPTEYYVKSKGEIWAKVPYRLTFNQERYTERSEKVQDKMVISKCEKTKKQAEKEAKRQIRLWAKENLPENAQILNISLNFSYKKNIIEVGVTIEVYQQIGEEKENIIGQKNSDQ